jgi:uracil phosphoribosyltransferase
MPVIVVKNSLVGDSLAWLRDAATETAEFRRCLRLVATVLIAEAVRDIAVRKVNLRTPLDKTEGEVIDGASVVAVPVLRAGIGMLGALVDLIPSATIGFIGLKRDEKTFAPHEYYNSLPDDLSGKTTVILDPMLATGGSLIAAIGLCREKSGRDIRAVTLVSAPEGVREVERCHPGARVYTAAIDKCLNSKAYIVPGIGDAGDRFCGTI